jgi:hypothetical protein
LEVHPPKRLDNIVSEINNLEKVLKTLTKIDRSTESMQRRNVHKELPPRLGPSSTHCRQNSTALDDLLLLPWCPKNVRPTQIVFLPENTSSGQVEPEKREGD